MTRSRDYYKASGGFALAARDEYDALLCNGKAYWRTISAKCRACRNSAKRFAWTATGGSDRCEACGNPYVYGYRPNRERTAEWKARFPFTAPGLHTFDVRRIHVL